jgi:hypothetical protein
MVCALAGLLLHCSLLAGAEQGQPAQKPADQLLLEIMDLHGQLVTNDVFLAQAKMLGAYLESAQPMEETKKITIYRRVLDMLLKIKASVAEVPANPSQQKPGPQQKVPQEQIEDKSVFVPGAGLLEIFKFDPKQNQMGDLPVIRRLWKRDLAYSGGFVAPDRWSDVGPDADYGARFSFYYEVPQSGRYGFTFQKESQSQSGYAARSYKAFRLRIGGTDIIKTTEVPAGQGVADLAKGFHRVEFWLYDKTASILNAEGGNFQVKVLTPQALDAVPLTKDMMLLKADQLKAAQERQPGKTTTGQTVPYVDY